MPFFHLSTDELTREIRRLLTELAERTHAGDADQIDVKFLACQHVMGGLTFAPRPEPGEVVDAARFERECLGHWLPLVPDLEDVTIIVRRYGRPVRTLVLEPPIACPSDGLARE
jgi:hypothetical protein